ncbi:MAG: hypothetical protein ACFHX7_20770 [Pseudomonadota bacterium]
MSEFLPGLLVAISGFIVFLLGAIHIVFTFSGSRLSPKDIDLQSDMQRIAPRVSPDTTMWRAWIGFNASHSMGAMLYGVVYAYLAILAPVLLFDSLFLAMVGAIFLCGYLYLAYRYWFKIPLYGILVAAFFYGAGYVAALA